MSWNYVEGVPLFGTYRTYKRAFVGCWWGYIGNKKRPESDESTPEPGSKKSKAPVSDCTLTGLFLKMTLYYKFLSWSCQDVVVSGLLFLLSYLMLCMRLL